MRLRTSASACAVAVGIAACAGNSYPATVQHNFLSACEISSKASTCRCILSNVESHVSLDTFRAADRATRRGSQSYPGWLISAAESCAGK